MRYLYTCGHIKFADPPRSNLTKEIKHPCAACIAKKVFLSKKDRVSSLFNQGTRPRSPTGRGIGLKSR